MGYVCFLKGVERGETGKLMFPLRALKSRRLLKVSSRTHTYRYEEMQQERRSHMYQKKNYLPFQMFFPVLLRDLD